jgi:hypothetical protein
VSLQKYQRPGLWDVFIRKVTWSECCQFLLERLVDLWMSFNIAVWPQTKPRPSLGLCCHVWIMKMVGLHQGFSIFYIPPFQNMCCYGCENLLHGSWRQSPGVRSHLCHSLASWPWASFLPFLGLTFPTYKMGSSQCWWKGKIPHVYTSAPLSLWQGSLIWVLTCNE